MVEMNPSLADFCYIVSGNLIEYQQRI